MDTGMEFVRAAVNTFEIHKRLAERAVEQMSDEQLRAPMSRDTNSVAVIMKHVAGNLSSRWTDFLSTDGEKPWRHRDQEFVDTFANRGEVLEFWEAGWKRLFVTLRSLESVDLSRTVMIRGEPHSVALALGRSLAHTSYHVGQIVHIARYYAGDHWETLTIPRGGSEAFNRRTWGSAGS